MKMCSWHEIDLSKQEHDNASESLLYCYLHHKQLMSSFCFFIVLQTTFLIGNSLSALRMYTVVAWLVLLLKQKAPQKSTGATVASLFLSSDQISFNN